MAERFRFTKGRLEALKAPKAGRATVYDAEVPKLALRVTAADTRTFYVIRRNGAGMDWVKLGVFPDMTVENARKAANGILGDYAKGMDPAAKRREAKAKQTLGEAFEQYQQLHVGPRGIKSADEILAMWERFLGALPDAPAKKHGRKRAKHKAGVDWSRRGLDAITNAEVRALHAAIGRTHRTMANRVIELVSSIYNRAREWGFPGANPAEGIEPFREEKRDRFIQPDELPRFFKALRDDTSADFQHFVLLALLTGARRGNILAMRWQEIDLESATWRIGRTKNDEPVFVALVPEAVEILRKREPQEEGFVFPAESASSHMTPPKKRWRALLDRAELEDFRIHDLRRSLGSWQAITGASLVVIGKSLGHRSPNATAIYARLHLDPVRAAVGTATSAMLTAAGVKKPAKVEKLRGARRRA